MRHCIASIISFALLMLLGSSCDFATKIPLTGTPKIVLLGELTAGDSVAFRGGKSTPLQEAGTQQEMLRDLAVTLKDASGNSWQLPGVEDDFSAMDNTMAYAGNAVLQGGSTYTVEASSPGLGNVRASVAIPGPFTAAVTDTGRTLFQHQPVLRIETTIQDDGTAPHYYAIEVLLKNELMTVPTPLQFYTDDAASETVLDGDTTTLRARVLLQDKSFSGTVHTTTIYIPLYQIPEQFPGDETYTVVQVKSISADYFHFLQAYAKNQDFFFFFTQANAPPVVIKGNVENGLGMLGGTFLREYSFLF